MFSTETIALFNFSQDGVFLIELLQSDEFGCSNSSAQQIEIIPPVLDLSLDDILIENRNGFSEITLEISNKGNRTVRSFDAEIIGETISRFQENWQGNSCLGLAQIYCSILLYQE